ncbi:unnamed protein product [Mytilus coruscus]|uniref:Uncharacterized protein n=1 Tax=Mytilus coruscus TaxID=42192 RepID=A0A6J8AGX0_MYTCO|nr:unnamed protein product [Mytilus coruscus]
MVTAERGHMSEMDNSPRDDEMIDAIKRRNREIYREKTRKASETSQMPVQQDVDEAGPSVSKEVGKRSTRNGITMQSLWEKISNMADVNKRQIDSHTEIIANLAANTLTVQDAVTQKNVPKTKANTNAQKNQVDNDINTINSGSEVSDNGLEDRSDDEDDELNIDDIVDTIDDTENKAFLDELEKMYKEPKKFGEKIDDQMAKLVDQAINKPLKTETLTKLDDTYLVPENCKHYRSLKSTKKSGEVLKTRSKEIQI